MTPTPTGGTEPLSAQRLRTVTAHKPQHTPHPARPLRRWALGGAAVLLLGLPLAWYLVPVAAPAAAPLHCELPGESAHAPHPGMVWVPGGRFEFGDLVYPEEQPVQTVSVDGFWMDRTEVTNDAFAAFVQATGYVTVAERPVDAQRHPGLPPDMQQPGAVVFTPPHATHAPDRLTQWWRYTPGAQWRHPQGPGSTLAGRGSHPVVAVTYEDAQAYARWRGRALPSEMQWEWAARAGQTRTGQDHAQPLAANTWQGLFPVINTREDGFAELAPVGCYSANALGLWDMIGNAWELTTDGYTPHHAPPQEAVSAPAASDVHRGAPVGQRVIKGGSYLCAPNYCTRYRSSARQPQDDDLGTSHVGFRTILQAPGP